LFDNVRKSITGISTITSFGALIVGAIAVLMIVVGGRDISSGAMSLGDFIMYIFFTGLMVAPIIQMASIGTQISEAFAGLDRIRDLMHMTTEDEEDERVCDDKRQPDEKDDFLPGRHGTGAVFPQTGRSVVRPTLKALARLGVVRTVRAHHANFHEAEIGDHHQQPGSEPPRAHLPDSSTADKEQRQRGQQEGNQVSGTEMTVDLLAERTANAVGGATCCNRSKWVGKGWCHLKVLLPITSMEHVRSVDFCTHWSYSNSLLG